MSIGHGTKIVKDGLVFAYDMGSPLSWKGRPTTNIVSNWDLDTGWSKGYAKNIRFNEIPAPSGVPNNAPTVGFEDTNTDSICYWYSYGDYASGQTPGSTMTISIYVKIIGSPATIKAYTADNSEVGRVWTSDITVSESEGWKRCVWTITIPSNSVSESLSFNMSLPPSTRMWLCAPQMELGSSATSFVAGTRSSTESIIDVMGGNLVTPNPSLTYNSENTFSFRGTDLGSSDRLLLSDTGYPASWADPYSLEVVFKVPSGTTWYHQGSGTAILGRGGYAGSHGFLKNGTGSVAFWNRTDAASYSITKSGLADDIWHHLLGVHKGASGFDFYYNGDLVGTNTSFSYTSATSIDGGSWQVGGGVAFGGNNGLYGGGDIPIAKLYNRALSQSEVRQNFEAIRGRFGI